MRLFVEKDLANVLARGETQAQHEYISSMTGPRNPACKGGTPKLCMLDVYAFFFD